MAISMMGRREIEMSYADELTGLPIDPVPSSPRCAKCMHCCMSLPGQFYPHDLGDDKISRQEKARSLLETGNYSIDWYEDDDPIYHLRPSTLKKRGHIFDGSWGGICVMLGDNGCRLDVSNRPTICRALIPGEYEDDGCIGPSKADVAAAWLNDSAWLNQLGIDMQVEISLGQSK